VNEILTRAEMEERFDGEWVLIADPETDEYMDVLRGRVVSHGEDADAVYREATDQNIRHWASLYFGPLPKQIYLIGGSTWVRY